MENMTVERAFKYGLKICHNLSKSYGMNKSNLIDEYFSHGLKGLNAAIMVIEFKPGWKQFLKLSINRKMSYLYQCMKDDNDSGMKKLHNSEFISSKSFDESDYNSLKFSTQCSNESSMHHKENYKYLGKILRWWAAGAEPKELYDKFSGNGGFNHETCKKAAYVIKRRYFSQDVPTYKQIGTELSITKQAVENIEKRAIKMLSQLPEFKEYAR